MEPGIFITFEGGEGAGKTTLIQRLTHHLQSIGMKVLFTREPGGSDLGKRIRHWLLDEDCSFSVCPTAELLLFLADRAQHIEEVILPALRRGEIVFCDRFHDSTIAYQGSGRGLGFEFVQNLCYAACQIPIPNLTFYLDVPPNEGLSRSQDVEKKEAVAGQLDKMESEAIEFHERVRKGYLLLAKQNPDRMTVLNALMSKEEVYNQAVSCLTSRL